MAEGTSIINQTNFDLSGAIWLCSEGKQVLNKKHLRLLEAIDTTGSISAAAKSLPMSYKAAWDAVDSLNMAEGKRVELLIKTSQVILATTLA
ncbi:MAG: LysR family transcriptional regulator [Chitinispirillaceae bacterium]